jgi:hypothetical protein
VTLTREELYEKVWSEPMWTLAQSFGLSDVGLAKTCARHKIPVPGRGYWRQKQVGQRVRATPLPKLSTTQNQSLGTVTLRPRALEPAIGVGPADAPAEPPVVTVPDILVDPHPLVAHTIKALRRVKPSKEGLLPRPTAGDYLDVRVSLGTVDRTMCILDALLRAMDERSMSIRVQLGQDGGSMSAEVLDESVRFHIEERTEHVTLPAPPPRRPGEWVPRPETKIVPTGALEFHIDSQWPLAPANVRTSWCDGKKQRVEDCLGKIVVAFTAAATAIKADRLAREEANRRWKEDERRRKIQAWEARQAKRRHAALTEELELWRSCREIRAYVEARRARGTPGGEGSERLSSWLDWIEGYAQALEERFAAAAGPDPEPFDERAYYY